MKREDSESIARKRLRELITVEKIIKIFCRGKHKTEEKNSEGLCPDCQELMEYTRARVKHCPHMEEKTFCSFCKTHCYKKDMRERITEAMRYGGPRMVFHSPILAMHHILLGWQVRRDEKK